MSNIVNKTNTTSEIWTRNFYHTGSLSFKKNVWIAMHAFTAPTLQAQCDIPKATIKSVVEFYGWEALHICLQWTALFSQ